MIAYVLLGLGGLAALVVGAVRARARQDERRGLAALESTPTGELVERTRALLEQRVLAPDAKAEALARLARRDHGALLQSMRDATPWYTGPQGYAPAEDMTVMAAAAARNEELRLLVAALARRAPG